MRSTFACFTAFAATALAHYNFEKLIVNDNVTGAYEYVRQTTNANSPVTDVTSQDFVCNAGGSDAAIMAKTATYTVQAGDQVGFTINSNLGHPGPLHVYMSKAPATAQSYDGSGEWFKVYALTTSSITDAGLQWASSVDGGISNFTFTLPADLAAGEYLMRGEHIALHGASTAGGAQFYMGCAQLKVESSGTSTPTETVAIPGVYDGTEPGILLNIYYPAPTNYTDPGPATWPSACEDNSANFAGQASDGDCTGATGSTSSSPGGSSSSAASATGSGSGLSATPTATATGAGSSATGSGAAALSAAGVSSDSSSSSTSNDSCASSKRKRVTQKKRAEKKRPAVKRGLGLMRD